MDKKMSRSGAKIVAGGNIMMTRHALLQKITKTNELSGTYKKEEASQVRRN